MSRAPHPWARHRALALLAERWPQLPGESPPSRATLAAMLAAAASPWALVGPHEARDGYEAAVVDGRIPTREGSWHDTFNLVAFLAFPRSKAALHRRALELQRGRGRVGPRSREEDALALIDETSLIVAGTPAGVAAFEAARATRDPARLDAVVRGAPLRVEVFGHALYEHLVLDRPAIGAGVTVIELDGDPAQTRAAVDAALATRIAAGAFPRPQLSPTLPWPDPLVDRWLAPLSEPGAGPA